MWIVLLLSSLLCLIGSNAIVYLGSTSTISIYDTRVKFEGLLLGASVAFAISGGLVALPQRIPKVCELHKYWKVKYQGNLNLELAEFDRKQKQKSLETFLWKFPMMTP